MAIMTLEPTPALGLSNDIGAPKLVSKATESSVLVIEDNPQVGNILSFFLTSVGYQTDLLKDGTTALAHISSMPPPSIVLLDRMLPGANGDDILRTIRASTSWSEVPVVVLSARSDLDEMKQIMQAGADAYLSKPFQATQMLKVVERLKPS